MKKLLQNKGAISFSESLALKAVSLLLALILWITILGFKREELKVNVKFEPLVSPGMMITSRVPNIQFTLTGPRFLLKDVQRKLQPIRSDLRRRRETIIPIPISEDLLPVQLPVGVKVTSFSPSLITLRLEELIEKRVSVKPDLRGLPAEGYVITKVQVEPSKVVISGPKSLVDELAFVGTEVFDTQDLKGAKEGLVAIEIDDTRGFRLISDRVVRVRVLTKRYSKNP